MRKLNFTIISAVILAMAAFLTGGCSSMPKGLSLPSWQETSSPQEIIAVWDTILRTENDKNYRGFAARVMFYDSNSKKALKVRGNFDVYVFNEEATGKAAVVPAKIVRYQMNDLKALQSDSKMFGVSYTLWVPWDELSPDSEEQRLSLFVRFKCEDGTIVVSKQATITLPGSPEKMLEKADVEYENSLIENRLRQTAFLAKKAEQHKSDPGVLDTEWNGTVAEHVISRENRPQAMLTTTINVPGISRDGVPTVMPERRYASASDEQKYRARSLVADARAAHQSPSEHQPNDQSLQNALFAAERAPTQDLPINQVQFQSMRQENMNRSPLQPAFGQSVPQNNVPQTMPRNDVRNTAPVDEEALYREFLTWKNQQQQQNLQTTLPSEQPLQGNFAAANSGTTWR